MEKNKTSRKFLTTALVAIMLISIVVAFASSTERTELTDTTRSTKTVEVRQGTVDVDKSVKNVTVKQGTKVDVDKSNNKPVKVEQGTKDVDWNKWTAVWNDAGSTQIGIDDRKVSLYLQSADNIAGFQSDGDYMEASNAFLILEKKEEPKPDIWVDPTSFDVTLSTNTIQDYTMRIGNDGEATLMYDISDDETTPKAVVHSEVSEEVVVEALVESHEYTIELFPSRSISYPISWIPHEISYDDGTAEGAIAWVHAGGRWAVRFTPPSYPVDLDTARICLSSRDEDYEQFYIEVYDDDGAEGSPGTLLGTVMTIATADGWHDVDISDLGITITSGDFYIAYMQLTDLPKCEMLSFDKTDPQGRSWGSGSGSTNWSTWPHYNWMIRCVVDLLPDLIITEKWLCWPDNCTICYNVTNTGNGTAPAGHNTALYVDDEEVAQDHVPVALALGESYTGCFNGYEWGYTPPSDDIRVCADSNEALDEVDETNNCLTNIWMCGDVRKDGYVTAWDVAVLNSYVAGIGELEVERKWAGDVRTDGYITAWDVAVLNSKVAGIGAISCMCTEPDL